MADDIITQADKQAKANHEELIRLRIVNATLHDEIERLRAVIDAVADLHDLTKVDSPWCPSCHDWPCATHLIVCDECREARRD